MNGGRVAELRALAEETTIHAEGVVYSELFHRRGLNDTPGSRYSHGYSTTLGVDFPTFVHDRKTSEPFVVLDVGCGIGTFAFDLERVVDGVVAFGLDKISYVDQVHRTDGIIVGDAFYPDASDYIMNRIPTDSIDLLTMMFCVPGHNVIPTFIETVRRILSPTGMARIFKMGLGPKKVALKSCADEAQEIFATHNEMLTDGTTFVFYKEPSCSSVDSS